MSVPILMYHALAAESSPITITPATFSAQMQWLHENGWQTITFGDLVGCIRRREPLPQHTVCLTFDDGFAGLYAHAYPVLQRHGFSATVFLVASYCGRDNGWAGQPDGIPILPLLDWDQIAEMAAGGIEFGAHTMTHPRLDLLPPAKLAAEIVAVREVLRERLALPIDVFAYPYGRFNDHTRALVAQTYLGACTTRPGRVTSANDVWELPRIDAFYLQHPFLFHQLANPLLFQYLNLRGVARTAVSAVRQRPW